MSKSAGSNTDHKLYMWIWTSKTSSHKSFLFNLFIAAIHLFLFSLLDSPSGPRPPVWSSSITPQTTHTVRLLWASDLPVAENSTWQHTTLTGDRHQWPGRIRTCNPKKWATADLRFRLLSQWDRPAVHPYIIILAIQYEQQQHSYAYVLAVYTTFNGDWHQSQHIS